MGYARHFRQVLPRRAQPVDLSLADEFLQVDPGLLVRRVEHCRTARSGGQHVVGMPDKPGELLVVDAAGLHLGVERPGYGNTLDARFLIFPLLAPAECPSAVPAHHVVAHDHATPVPLEPLRRIHTADLVEAVLVDGPDLGRWRLVLAEGVAVRVPRPVPVTDPYVGLKASLLAQRLGPRPAVAA